jgi:hypothetical protein
MQVTWLPCHKVTKTWSCTHTVKKQVSVRCPASGLRVKANNPSPQNAPRYKATVKIPGLDKYDYRKTPYEVSESW